METLDDNEIVLIANHIKNQNTFVGIRDYSIFTKEGALKGLLATHELLQPLPFLMFVQNTDLVDVITYREYSLLMRKKALKLKINR